MSTARSAPAESTEGRQLARRGMAFTDWATSKWLETALRDASLGNVLDRTPQIVIHRKIELLHGETDALRAFHGEDVKV